MNKNEKIKSVYSLTDSREVDRYPDFLLFENLKDAEDMRDAMGSDKAFFDIHKVEIIT